MISFKSKQTTFTRKCLSLLISFFFLSSAIIPPTTSYAQFAPQTILNLPIPGTMVSTSNDFTPPIIRGLSIYPDNPLRFGFIVDTGDDDLQGEAFKEESTKLIKYFLASLTTPEKEFWVNLSPYEKDRIIPEGLGQTELGRDMLAQDYLLKQLTASLMYPEENLGKEFWNRVYTEAQELYGTTEIPVNTFNKVWIVPDKAVVYEHENKAFVEERHLKVMLEEDYAALQENIKNDNSIPETELSTKLFGKSDVPGTITSQIIKKILVPEIEKEINEGKFFANLRQIYNSMILATWYKKSLKNSLLGQVYVDQNKTKGIDIEDKEIKHKIYNQYLEAFKKGVYNYIKEDVNPKTQQIIPRKYFSGGLATGVANVRELEVHNVASPVELKNILASSAVEDNWGKQQEIDINLLEIGSKGDIEAVKKAIAAGSPIKNQRRKTIIAIAVIAGLLQVTGLFQKITDNVFPEIEKLTSSIHKTIDQKGYWMNLVHQNKYEDVFERSGEFLQEPFAFEVLKNTALVSPRGPYYTSSNAAIDHYDHYASHPRALEIARIAINNGAEYEVYSNIRRIIEAPRGLEVIKYTLSHNPVLTLEQFNSGGSQNFLRAKNPDFDFTGLLDALDDPVADMILTIWNSPYDMETKKKITALTHRLVEGSFSIEEAVEVTQEDVKFFRELIRIRSTPNFIGGYSVIDSLERSANKVVDRVNDVISEKDTQSVAGRIEIERLLYEFSAQEIYYAIIFGITKENEESFDYLYSKLKEKLPQSQIPLHNLFPPSDFDSDFIRFFGLLTKYDLLQDFLNTFELSDVQALLSRLNERPRKGYEYYSFGINSPAAALIMTEYLVKNVPERQRKFFIKQVDLAKEEIAEFYNDNPGVKRSTFMKDAQYFRSQPFIHEIIREVVEEAAETNPGYFEFFHHSDNFIDTNYGLEAFLHAAYQNPQGAMHAVFNSDKTKRILRDVHDPVIQKVLELEAYKLPKPVVTDLPLDKKDEMALLMDDYVKGRLSFAEGFELTKNPFRLRNRLLEIKSREGSIGIFAIDENLSEFYLKTVRQMNNLHNESDDVRFSGINTATPEDIYYLMVYGEQEIYTSTFNGIFDRLLQKMHHDSLSGTKLLKNVKYFQFRSFVRLVTGFGRLNEFLSSMDKVSQSQLLEQFVKGIEKEKKYLQQATVVADAFSMIDDKNLLIQLQKFIKEEFDRVTIENHKEGIVLYEILSGLFGKKAVINKTWFKEMSDKFGLPTIDKVSTDKLFNQFGENIQQYFFYNDADGKQSFEHFISFYEKNSQWQVTFEKNHIQIVSVGEARKIVMFANKPDKEQKGAEDIAAIFSERKISPHIVVHRGHSYHAPKTIEQIPSTTLIVSLGSCGGFHLVADVINHAPNAHILSTKGTGSMYVNDPLLKMLNKQILNGEDTIFWNEFWGDAEEHITSTYFTQYIAPHRNIGALFLKAYNNEISKISSSSSSSPIDETENSQQQEQTPRTTKENVEAEKTGSPIIEEISLETLKKSGLQSRLSPKEEWFINGHPSKLFHDLGHSTNVAGVAYRFAKKRGLSEKQAAFLYEVGLLHDFDPDRDTNTGARVPETMAVLTRDFNKVQSLSGKLNESILRDRLGWGPKEYLMAMVIIQRSEHPFGNTHYNPFYEKNNTSPYKIYKEFLTKLNSQDTNAAKFALQEAALFSEYTDKSSGSLLNDFPELLDVIHTLVKEININAGKEVLNFQEYAPVSYETFTSKLGREKNFAFDRRMARLLEYEDIEFLYLDDALKQMPEIFAQKFKANLAGFKKFYEEINNGKSFDEARLQGENIYKKQIQAFINQDSNSAGSPARADILESIRTSSSITPEFFAEKKNRPYIKDMVEHGLKYEEVVAIREAKKRGYFRKFPDGTFTTEQTVKNFILVVLDEISDFKKARKRNDIKKMAELYRRYVIHYESRDKENYSNGQQAFFMELGGIASIFTNRFGILAKPKSPAALLRFALPGLIDLTSSDALDPLEVEKSYWTDPENALYHYFLALDTIDGFKKAREEHNIKKMAGLYREHVINYQSKSSDLSNGQTAFLIEVGGLTSLLSNKQPYLSKKMSAPALLRFAIDGAIDPSNPDALHPLEVDNSYWNDEVNAQYHIDLALSRIPGFDRARKNNDIKTMANLYRIHVLKYSSKKKGSRNGQVAFFIEVGGLVSLISKSRAYFQNKTKKYSPVLLVRFAVEGLVDPSNPDALDPIELERYYWNDPDNARFHIYQTLDKIPKFNNARKANDVKTMAKLYRDYVGKYIAKDKSHSNGQQAFFHEIGGLQGLMGNDRDFFEWKDSPHAVLKFAIPSLVDQSNPDALTLQELHPKGPLAKGLHSASPVAATMIDNQIINSPGGIDFNPELLDLQIKRDGNGVPLPLMQQPIGDMHIEGFLPVIINISPITIPMILGLVEEEEEPFEFERQTQLDPMDQKYSLRQSKKDRFSLLN